jgi:hypothetical protein
MIRGQARPHFSSSSHEKSDSGSIKLPNLVYRLVAAPRILRGSALHLMTLRFKKYPIVFETPFGTARTTEMRTSAKQVQPGRGTIEVNLGTSRTKEVEPEKRVPLFNLVSAVLAVDGMPDEVVTLAPLVPTIALLKEQLFDRVELEPADYPEGSNKRLIIDAFLKSEDIEVW